MPDNNLMQDEPFFPDLSEGEWAEIFEHDLRMEEYDAFVKPVLEGRIDSRDPAYFAWQVRQFISEV